MIPRTEKYGMRCAITKYKRQCAELYLPWLLSDSWKDRQNRNLNLCRAAFAIIAMILCHCLCLCSLFHFQKIWVWARCLPADDAFDLWANSGTGTSTWSGTGSRKRLFMVGHTPQDPKIRNVDNPPAYLFPQKRRTNNFKEYYWCKQ